jgi:hypothetical protein
MTPVQARRRSIKKMTLKNRRAIKLPTTKPVASLLTSSDMAASFNA